MIFQLAAGLLLVGGIAVAMLVMLSEVLSPILGLAPTTITVATASGGATAVIIQFIQRRRDVRRNKY